MVNMQPQEYVLKKQQQLLLLIMMTLVIKKKIILNSKRKHRVWIHEAWLKRPTEGAFHMVVSTFCRALLNKLD